MQKAVVCMLVVGGVGNVVDGKVEVWFDWRRTWLPRGRVVTASLLLLALQPVQELGQAF